MNRPIELIKNVDALTGTDYFEFLPGEYSGQCWCKDSVFLDEEVFSLIEPSIASNSPNYDHYAFTSISRTQWTSIIEQWKKVAVALDDTPSDAIDQVLGMMFTTTKQQYLEDEVANRLATKRLILDLSSWLRTTLRVHERITVLGM
jgi:hypothetical protein